MISRKNLLKQTKKSIDAITGTSKLKSLIIPSEDGLSINWKKVVEFRNRGDFLAAGLLIDLEILTFSTKGNYELVQRGISANPYSPVPAYFREKKDAFAFREALEPPIFDERKLNLGTHPIKLVQYLD